MINTRSKRKLQTKFIIRRIITASVFLLLIQTISAFFLENWNKNEAKVITNELVVSNSESGSIAFDENEFYKKYTIDCSESIANLNTKEDKDKFQILIDKSKILNVDFKKGAKVNLDEVNYEDNKNLFVLNFKKLTEAENYVHLDYKNNNKIVIFIKKKQSPLKYNVVVDPGHGGIDVGTYYGKLFEKDLTLKISQYMVDNLRYNGCYVTFTRNTDILLDKLVKQDLIKRAKLANDEKADVFVSVHINSNKDRVYNGVSTYYYGKASNKETQRAKFAQAVQKEMLKDDTWKDIGTHGEDLAVLRTTKMPSVLVECGFITNSLNRSKLSKEATLVDFGENISNGVMKYLNQSKTETNSIK